MATCRALFKKCCWTILAEKFNTATLLFLPSIVLFSISFSKNILLPSHTFDNSSSLCSILPHCPSIYYFDASPKSFLEHSPVPSLISFLKQSHQVQLCDLIQIPTESQFNSTFHNYQINFLISSDYPTSYFIKFVYDNLDCSLHFTILTNKRRNGDDAIEAVGSFILYSSIISQVPLLNKQGTPATVAIEDESSILRSDSSIKFNVLFQILSALLPFYVIACKTAIKERRKGMGVLLRREGLSISLSFFFELSRFLLLAFLSVSFFLLTLVILQYRFLNIFQHSPSELFIPILMHVVILITRGFLGAELFNGSFAVIVTSFIMLSEIYIPYSPDLISKTQIFLLSFSYIFQFIDNEQNVHFKLKELMAVVVANIGLTLILQHRWKVIQLLKYRWYYLRSRNRQKFISSFDIELNSVLFRNKKKTNINLDQFQASKGEAIAFYGNDISEGSDLLRLITGTKSPHNGFVQVFGKDPFRERWKVRGLFSHCSKDHYFWPNLTVLQHIHLLQILYGRDDNITDMLISTGLINVQNCPLKHLSYSMKSRLNIVLSDIKSHPLIIMIQPTEGLDLNEKLKFLDYIQLLKKRALLLVVTNNTTEAYSLGDRILFLHQGEVAFEGTQCSLPPLRNWNTLRTETQCQPSSALTSTKVKLCIILKSSLNNILAHFKLLFFNKIATLCLFLLPFLFAMSTKSQLELIDMPVSAILIHNDTALRGSMKMSFPDNEKIDMSLLNDIQSLTNQDNSIYADPFSCDFEFYHLQKDCIKIHLNVTGELYYPKDKDKCLRWILGQFAVLGISRLSMEMNANPIIRSIEGVFGEELVSGAFNYQALPKIFGEHLILVCSFLGGCFFLYDKSPKLERKVTKKVNLVGFWIGTAVFHMMILEVFVGILLGMSPLWPFLADGRERLLGFCLFVTGTFINGLSYLYASFMRSDANFITCYILLLNVFRENMRKNQNLINPLVLYNQMIISSVSGMTSLNHTWIPMILLLLYGGFLFIIACLIDIHKSNFIQFLKEKLKFFC